MSTKGATALVHNSGCDDIALGLDSTSRSEAALFEFSLKTGAPYHKHWPGTKIWYQKFLDYLNDGKTRIHFNLDDIPNPKEMAKVGATADPYVGHATAWELYQIQITPSAWSRVIFHRDGKPLPYNPLK
ncbi:hypothetical protein [Amycolatopsis sp. NPDC052450]|uniref:hypothetical protein n=1 Tax=Amycolatopsis sp. NPDC052450 TaxID=3363937 RepID=UPI0037C93C5F